MSVIGMILRSLMERRGRSASIDEWADRLAASGNEVAARLTNAADTPKHRALGAHIVGIERWGQRRLRTLLGEPFVRDEYDGYRPPASDAMPALGQAFQDVRDETLALVGQIEAAGCDDRATAPHNDMGDLSIRGWLVYLGGHATMESRKIR